MSERERCYDTDLNDSQAGFVSVKSRRVARTRSTPRDGGMQNQWHIALALSEHGVPATTYTRRPFGGEPEGPSEIPLQAIIEVPVTASQAASTLERDYDEAVSFAAGLASAGVRPGALVHTHHWTSAVDLDSWLPAGAPLVHTPHLLACEKAAVLRVPLPNHILKAEHNVLSRANAVIAVSQHEARSIIDTYAVDPGKVHVIPNGVASALDAPARHPRRGQGGQGALRLVSVGRLAFQRGFDRCIDAAGHLAARGVPAELRLVGGPYGEPAFERQLARLRESAQSRDLTIEFLGGLAHDVVLNELRSADYVLNLSRYESQGTAQMEAMALERVVISSAVGAVPEYLRHQVSGIVVSASGAPASAADWILRLEEQPARRRELEISARESAASYTWERMQESTLKLFEALGLQLK